MLVVPVVVGAGAGCTQQAHSSQGSKQQAFHRVLGSGLRVLGKGAGCLILVKRMVGGSVRFSATLEEEVRQFLSLRLLPSLLSLRSMKSIVLVGLSGVLATLPLIAAPASAQQMFPAGGRSGTTCPGGSSYKGSGYCRATKPGQQFFPAGGSGGSSCPGGSSYAGAGYCKTR